MSEPKQETKTQHMSAGIRTPRSNMKQGTQMREHTDRAHSKPHRHMKTGHDGSVRAVSQNPWMTPDWNYRTLQVKFKITHVSLLSQGLYI